MSECIAYSVDVPCHICSCGPTTCRHRLQGPYSCCVRGFTPMRTGPNCWRREEIDRCYRAPSWSEPGVSFDSPVAQLLHPPFDTRTIEPSYFTNHFSSSRKVLVPLELLSVIQYVFRESICTFNSLTSFYTPCQYNVPFLFSHCQYKSEVTLKAEPSRMSSCRFDKTRSVISYFSWKLF
jgi:hypothetical protein